MLIKKGNMYQNKDKFIKASNFKILLEQRKREREGV